MNDIIRVSSALIYPVKSCGGLSQSEAVAGPEGLLFDRTWRIVDENGDTLTQPACPRLALIRVEFKGSCLALRFADQPDCLLVPMSRSATEPEPVRMSESRLGIDAGDNAAKWLSTVLDIKCRLMRIIPSPAPLLIPAEKSRSERLFVGYPILIISDASLVDLNARLETGVFMNRFRPNLILSGGKPYQEEGWKRIRIGDLTLQASDKCGRCATVLIDQEHGMRSGKEPLRELSKYRRENNEVIFGRYYTPENAGVIAIDDKVTILE